MSVMVRWAVDVYDSVCGVGELVGFEEKCGED